MKKLDLMKKKKEELDDILLNERKNLFKLRSSSIAGEDAMKKKAKVKNSRRLIARILTRLNNE